MDCRTLEPQTFLWVPQIPAPRPQFVALCACEDETFSLVGGAGSYGRNHLPTVPWNPTDLQDGPGNPARRVPPGTPPAPGEPHRAPREDPRGGTGGRAAKQDPHLRQD